MTTNPLATQIAERTALMLTVDPVTRELYGYAAPVLDEQTTLRRFSAAYYAKASYTPSPAERETTLAVFRERFETLQAREGGERG